MYALITHTNNGKPIIKDVADHAAAKQQFRDDEKCILWCDDEGNALGRRKHMYAAAEFTAPAPPRFVAASNAIPDEAAYVLWSNRKQRWWKAAKSGYAENLENAGKYTFAEALEIAHDSNEYLSVDAVPHTVALSLIVAKRREETGHL